MNKVTGKTVEQSTNLPVFYRVIAHDKDGLRIRHEYETGSFDLALSWARDTVACRGMGFAYIDLVTPSCTLYSYVHKKSVWAKLSEKIMETVDNRLRGVQNG